MAKPSLYPFLLSLFLVCFIFGVADNFAYADSVTADNTQLQALCSTVNVRSGPSTGDQAIGQIGLGDTVQAIAKSGDWYQIDFSGGTGWVAGWLVQADQSSAGESSGLATVDTNMQLQALCSTVNVRSGPAQAIKQLGR